MPRKTNFDTLAMAGMRGAFDEYPIFPPDKDTQLCLSRNQGTQPFWLICQYDTVLAQMSGRGRIAFHDSSVRYFDMVQADYVYVPAGVPHRYSAETESIQYRYKAGKPGLEAVAWYCPRCTAELHRETWDCARELPQEAYLRASARFNQDRALRVCKSCGTEHDSVDVSSSKWAEVAGELRAELGGAALPPLGDTPAIVPHKTRPPLHQNVYWFARMVNAQLVPMFPYLDAGSIVPCVNMFYGGPGSNVGHFVHYNTVDEIFVNFGAVQSWVKPGIARVGTRSHGVGSFDTKDDPEGMVIINVITQRHPFDVPQREATIMLCHECKHEIARRDYDGNPAPSPDSDYHRPGLPTFNTLIESSRTAEDFNALGETIPCPKCGAQNRSFPLHKWGWDEYRKRTLATVNAMRAFAQATAATDGTGEQAAE